MPPPPPRRPAVASTAAATRALRERVEADAADLRTRREPLSDADRQRLAALQDAAEQAAAALDAWEDLRGTEAGWEVRVREAVSQAYAWFEDAKRTAGTLRGTPDGAGAADTLAATLRRRKPSLPMVSRTAEEAVAVLLRAEPAAPPEIGLTPLTARGAELREQLAAMMDDAARMQAAHRRTAEALTAATRAMRRALEG